METRVRKMTRKGPGIAIGSLQSLPGKGAKGAPEAQAEPQVPWANQACCPVTIYPH
jgi:hypothetical protein